MSRRDAADCPPRAREALKVRTIEFRMDVGSRSVVATFSSPAKVRAMLRDRATLLGEFLRDLAASVDDGDARGPEEEIGLPDQKAKHGPRRG